ncbi:MAG TPA: MlaE family lipid ABC transporter permease subunit, partial [Verrucomicrobiota bacterium]|nr:MlaE family lipid ABC transporter permease subunit [Verrucomicrobiota bacterium]
MNPMPPTDPRPDPQGLHWSLSEPQAGRLVLKLQGRMDATTLNPCWPKAIHTLATTSAQHFLIDASEVTYCDGAGIGMILDLRRTGASRQRSVEIAGLKDEFQQLLDAFHVQDFPLRTQVRRHPVHLPAQVGEAACQLWRDTRAQISYLGELTVTLARACRHPRQVRWGDFWWVAENVGVDALPIVALISFLMGLILAFQASIPMRQFGADIYVADLIGLVILRELGPLMSAIILAGRSGSSFAAEIGTMKVNEEINALTTMGLDPVAFLVVPRVLATLIMMPLLTLFANFMGLVGGAVVFVMNGFPLITYYHEIVNIVDLGDFGGGLLKSFVFGVLVALAGCLRGMQCGRSAQAVGDAATSAVVTSIVFIIVSDGLMA